MPVAYCRNSTLREVHAAVVGLPAPVSPDEFHSIRTRAAREWPEHTFAARRALMTDDAGGMSPDDVLPPAWFGEISWGAGRWTARWGHRVVALHLAILEGERYATFDTTLRPTLERWLRVARDAYAFAGSEPAAATVVVSYLNTFRLAAGDGDLSEWFKFNFTIDAAGVAGGLDEVSVGARIPRPELGGRVRVHLIARPTEAETQVTVQTVAECDLPDGSTFGQTAELLAQIGRAKVLAKETFFSFVTERTLAHMEATDDPQPTA